MARTVSIGNQDFLSIIENNSFYVDKTGFISDWWRNQDVVTLITRPRRFGKTLNMSMLECFFSDRYAGKEYLFNGLDISKDSDLMKEQGKWPVVFLSFANLKNNSFMGLQNSLGETISRLFNNYSYLFESDKLSEAEKEKIKKCQFGLSSDSIGGSLNFLCNILEKNSGKKAIVLLDEYDTPMQEAYINGYWNDAVSLFRVFFNSTFKTNTSLARAIITGITRISKESLFSDLNNLKIVSTTTPSYQTAFGFTEDEVFDAMKEAGLSDTEKVQLWYDGFNFGGITDIYNPWSVTNYIDTGKIDPYWINSSGNGLVSKLIMNGGIELKDEFGEILDGKPVKKRISEEIVFSDLDGNDRAIWSLLVASGYLKVLDVVDPDDGDECIYTLQVTNEETRRGLRSVIRRWYDKGDRSGYNSFIKALLADDIDTMNDYMSILTEYVISTFDTAVNPKLAPENFYHGLVLAMMVDLAGRFELRSNRESGRGRYDIMLRPKDIEHDDGYIIEFKVRHPEKGEKTLSDTVAKALAQIEEKNYAADLIDMGLPEERIHKYGFAFEGKEALIGK